MSDFRQLEDKIMDPDKELAAIVARLNSIGPLDARDPVEAAEAVSEALNFWASFLRDAPEVLCEILLTEKGRFLVIDEIAKMSGGLTRAAHEIARLRLIGLPGAQ